jgi:DHA3 family macrolide efflux protein-like MFS transporter
METQADEKTFKNYLLFFTGQQVSILGSSIAQFVLIWWITLETGSALYLSIAAFVGFAPMIVITPFAGVLADRWNRKKIIFTVDLLQALTTTALIFFFWLGDVSILQVLLFLALRSVYQAFNAPTVTAIVPLMVPREKLSRVNGLNYLLTGAMTLMGPVVAALLLAVAKVEQVLWIDPSTFVVALLPLLIIRIPSVRVGQERTPFKKDFSAGLSFIKSVRGLIPLITLATALNFLLVPLDTLLPYFVAFDHLGRAESLALILASMQGGMLAGGVMMSVVKEFRRKIVASLVFIYVIFTGYALIAVTPTGVFWFMALGGLVLGFGVAPANVSVQTILQTRVPLKMQGRIGSVTMALASAATPLGMLLAGSAVGFTGTSNLFLVCVVVGVSLLTLSWFFTGVRHVETGEEKTVLEEAKRQQSADSYSDV